MWYYHNAVFERRQTPVAAKATRKVIDTYSERKRKQQFNSIKRGGMAQLVERRVRNAEVRGSNPLTSTKKCRIILIRLFLSITE